MTIKKFNNFNSEFSRFLKEKRELINEKFPKDNWLSDQDEKDIFQKSSIDIYIYINEGKVSSEELLTKRVGSLFYMIYKHNRLNYIRDKKRRWGINEPHDGDDELADVPENDKFSIYIEEKIEELISSSSSETPNVENESVEGDDYFPSGTKTNLPKDVEFIPGDVDIEKKIISEEDKKILRYIVKNLPKPCDIILWTKYSEEFKSDSTLAEELGYGKEATLKSKRSQCISKLIARKDKIKQYGLI